MSSRSAGAIESECQRLLGPAVLQQATEHALTSTASKATNWTYYAGALVAGDDLGSENMTLADAESHCVGLDGCMGFTFEGATPTASSCTKEICPANVSVPVPRCGILSHPVLTDMLFDLCANLGCQLCLGLEFSSIAAISTSGQQHSTTTDCCSDQL